MATTSNNESPQITFFVSISVDMCGPRITDKIACVAVAILDENNQLLDSRRYNAVVQWPTATSMGDFNAEYWREKWADISAEQQALYHLETDELANILADIRRMIGRECIDKAIELGWPSKAPNLAIIYVNEDPALEMAALDYNFSALLDNPPLSRIVPNQVSRYMCPSDMLIRCPRGTLAKIRAMMKCDRLWREPISPLIICSRQYYDCVIGMYYNHLRAAVESKKSAGNTAPDV